MEHTIVHYLPLVTTGVAIVFTIVLFRHWRRKPEAKYLMCGPSGSRSSHRTVAESLTTVFGWSEPVF